MASNFDRSLTALHVKVFILELNTSNMIGGRDFEFHREA